MQKKHLLGFLCLLLVALAPMLLSSCIDSPSENSADTYSTSGFSDVIIGFRNRVHMPVAPIEIRMPTAGSTMVNSPSDTSVIYHIPENPSAILINGQFLVKDVPTIITLPNGTQVKVTWTSNIVLIDTLEMN